MTRVQVKELVAPLPGDAPAPSLLRSPRRCSGAAASHELESHYLRGKRTRGLGDKVFKSLLFFLVLCVPILMVALFWEILQGALPALKEAGFGFLTSSEWDPVADQYGAWPFIYGTLYSALVAMIIAVPLGVGTALFLAEYAPVWIKEPLRFLIELLAAIPSVIYGLWGIFVLVPWLRVTVEPFLSKTLGFLPLFQGPMFGIGFLAAGLILAVMSVPFITAICHEVFSVVPQHQREAALALGATKWEVCSIAVLRYARSGMVGGIMLGLGRAIGETMAVTMVIGNTINVSASLFSSGYTMASVLANEFAEAAGQMHTSALMAIGLVLLLVTAVVNSVARLLVCSIARGPSGGVRV